MIEDEITEKVVKQALLYSLIYGAQGYGKNRAAKEKLLWSYYDPIPVSNALDNGKLGVGTLYAKPRTELPPKVCYYGKPKLYWFGEVHGSNNFVHNPGYSMVHHWDVTATTMTVKGRNPDEGLSIWPAAPMGSTTGRSPLNGKRFIGISEPEEQHWDNVDNDFLKKLTGEEWVETKTYDKKSASWKPLGEVFVMSGKPLKINDRDKETIERVKSIEFPEA